MPELVLYGESTWQSPWVLHAMVALEEKRVSYRTELYALPLTAAQRTHLQGAAAIGKVPALVHGEVATTESSAISEYLDDAFPDGPRLYPKDLAQRARARQVMAYLRTQLTALREDRPTTSIFVRPVTTPLSEKGRAEAQELIRLAEAVVGGKTSMFDAWCIADCDLFVALMRLVANNDTVPGRLQDYALAQYKRQSVQRYVANIPTQR